MRTPPDPPATEAAGALSKEETGVLALIEKARPRLTDFLRSLVRFQTPNPPGGNEREAQAWIAERLEDLGMAVDIFDPLPGRPNVVGRLEGSGAGRSAMFNGHIDVAELRTPEAWTRPPFEGVVQDGRMYGLGASDMKSAHAGFLLALTALREAGCVLAGDVIYESVIGEETGEPGTRACVERGITADFAIVGECSKAEAVIVSSVGAVNARIDVSDPLTQHLIQRRRMVRAGGGLDGANCIEKMATKIIPALLELEQRWGVFKTHPMLPPGQALINVFSIEGGGNTFILPDSCRAFVTIVYLPAEDLEAVKYEVEEQVRAVATADGWLARHPPTVEWNPPEFPIEFVPIDGSPRDPGAALLANCLCAASGRPPEVRGRDAIMDGGWLHQAGIPTVVFGPGDKSVIHRPDEYVVLEDVLRYAKTIALFLLRWCCPTDGAPER
jgi:acetylornithine deacetylase/succinyl-diaminopimelate desuccinylase family protein